MSDLALKIPVRALMEHFCCPVCFDVISSSLIAPCGHHFCGKCLADSLNYHHKCPCCNAPTTIDQCHKDHQFDQLVATVVREREISENQYFEKLIADAASAPVQEERDNLSPIEQLFRTYLRDSLAANERLYREMKRTYAANRQRLMQLGDGAGVASADEQFQRSTIALVASYEAFLKQLPVPSVLPVRVNIAVPSRGYIRRGVSLHPTTSGAQVKALLLTFLLEDKVKVISIKEGSLFRIIPPVGLAADDDVISFHDGGTPLLEHNVLPDSTFELVGDIVHASDLPKRCFADSFADYDNSPLDYYTCNDCKLNWLCQSCVDCCHRDHKVVIFTKAHVPKWGCCYCVKSKKCALKSS